MVKVGSYNLFASNMLADKEAFDDIIIPVVLDTTVSLSTKLAKLENSSRHVAF